MTPEVKQRIEEIRRGKVPEGYKRGKLGIVPNDWADLSFYSLFVGSSQYTEDLERYPLYSLTIEDGITAKTERYERSHLVKKENAYKIVNPNEYAYNPMNLRFGAVARHKGNIPVAVSGYYDIFKTVHESDMAFMDSFLTSESMVTYYNKVSTGSLVEKQRVHFSTFLSFTFPLPSLEERKRIAEILSTQDRIIELLEKKVEQLQLMKKSYMQKMFPRAGSSVPEIRFSGFTGPWEQYKFGEIAQRQSETMVSDDDNPCVEYEDVIAEQGTLNKDIFVKRVCKNGIRFTPEDVLYGKLRPYLHNWLNPDFSGVAVGDWWVLRPIDADKNFLFRLLQTSKYDDAANQSSGTKMPRADWKLISNLEFEIPATLEEQERIAGVFDNLDNLISLQQRKRDEEIRKKQALMQLLLTGIVRTNE